MSEDRTKIGSMTVRGQAVDVFATIHQYGGKGEPRGRFEADIGTETVSGKTTEALYQSAMTSARRQAVKVEVPFSYVEGGEATPAVATGFHAGNRSILIRVGDEAKQMDGYRRTTLEPLDEAERAEYKRLWKASQETDEALREFRSEHALDLREAVEEAITEAVAAAQADAA